MRYVMMCVLLVWSSGAFAKINEGEDDLLSRWKREDLFRQMDDYRAWMDEQPPLLEIVNRALTCSQITLGESEEWARKARHASALPKLLFGYGADFTHKDTLVIEDNVSVTADDIVVGPRDSKNNYNLDEGHQFDLRLQWDLSGLIYHHDQLAWVRERRSQAQLRGLMTEKLSEVYLKRQEAAENEFLNEDEAKRRLYGLRRKNWDRILDAMTSCPKNIFTQGDHDAN